VALSAPLEPYPSSPVTMLAFAICIQLLFEQIYEMIVCCCICLQSFGTVGWRQKEHPACKKLGSGVVICLERGANDLYMFQLMPLPNRHLVLH